MNFRNHTSSRVGKLMTLFIVSAALLAAVPSSHGALISPVSATTDMGSGFSTLLSNTINGVGLSSVSLTATHDATLPTNSWVSAGPLIGDVTFNLGSLFSINGFSFWNQNNGGPGALGSTGIRNVMISYSTDNITFNTLLGAPATFAQETGNISSAQQFSFAAVNASFVRFTILSNYGDTAQSGFAEAQFNGGPASVPDGSSTLAMLGLALGGIAGFRRRICV